MSLHKPKPIDSFNQLQERVDRFFAKPSIRSAPSNQLSLGLCSSGDLFEDIDTPNRSTTEFLDFIVDSVPGGELYLFGGMLRDIAMFGKRGFNSDIDLVVDGDWINCIPYLERLGASKNKFGGYRLTISGQLIDIWNARETWAVKQGLVHFKNITSLTETTVLNWDAILMNWRTKNFIYPKNYLVELKERTLDVVLKSNPSPQGMAVRVFRHLCLKEPKKITPRAAEYLEQCTQQFTYDELVERELCSYGNSIIEYAVYRFFEGLNLVDAPMAEKLRASSKQIRREGLTLSALQLECDFENLVR